MNSASIHRGTIEDYDRAESIFLFLIKGFRLSLFKYKVVFNRKFFTFQCETSRC